MPKRKYYCFKCKVVKRRIYSGGMPELEFSDPSKTCPECNTIMVEGSNYPTPRKRDTKGWRELERRVYLVFHHRAVDNRYAGHKE